MKIPKNTNIVVIITNLTPLDFPIGLTGYETL